MSVHHSFEFFNFFIFLSSYSSLCPRPSSFTFGVWNTGFRIQAANFYFAALDRNPSSMMPLSFKFLDPLIWGFVYLESFPIKSNHFIITMLKYSIQNLRKILMRSDTSYEKQNMTNQVNELPNLFQFCFIFSFSPCIPVPSYLYNIR